MPSERDAKTGRFRKGLGMYIDSKGYWSYSAGEHRGRRVHTVLMEKHLGRKLKRNEQVHHRDGNKLNFEEHWDGTWNLELIDVHQHAAYSAKQLWFLKMFIWPREKQRWDEYFENCLSDTGTMARGNQ